MNRKKKIFALLTALVLLVTLCACGGSSEASDTEQKEEKETVYHVGDTWEVDGQWKFTVDKVSVTDERNEFEDENPAQVIVIDYHYENTGYEDESGLMDGLFIDVGSGKLIDAEGNMCSEYSLGSIDDMPQETPVGAKCSAQTAVGLKTEGSPVKIILDEYDGNGDEQEATFELEF